MRRLAIILGALLLAVCPVFAATLTGVVFDDANSNGLRDAGERGLPGVRVTDGYAIRLTGPGGDFTFTGERGLVTIYLTIPSGWWPTESKWWVSGEADSLQPTSFPLHPRTESPQDYFVQVTDLHTAKLTIPKVAQFCDQVNALEPPAAFVVATGDLVLDTTGSRNAQDALDQFHGYLEGMSGLKPTLFNVPGNHEHVGVMHPENWVGSPYFGKQTLRRLLGPLYYSFDWGPYHFVALDNTVLNSSGRGYHSEVNPDCLSWLRQDLQYVPRDQPIILLMHEPLGPALKTEQQPQAPPTGHALVPSVHEPLGAVVGWERVEQLLAGHRVLASFAGHMHRVTAAQFAGAPLYVGGALSGSWWTGNCPDGNPRGYSTVRMSPEGFARTYRAAD